MDKTDWQPVTDAAGNVLGWMSAPDPGEPDVDYFEADRPRKARFRAARLEEAAELLTDDAFDVEETWDAGLSAGLTDEDLDSYRWGGLPWVREAARGRHSERA